MKKIISALMLLCLGLPLSIAGCAPNVGSADYQASKAGRVQTVYYGTVRSVRVIEIHEDTNKAAGFGTIVGGVAGGFLGSLIGHGGGRVAASVGGALLGAGLGYGAGKVATRQEGYEVTVQMDSGETLAIAQGKDVTFSPGQRVKIMTGNDGSARVYYAY